MSLSDLVDLCESRIDELSRRRQGFEHLDVPEYVEILVGDLRAAASDWQVAAGHLPGGSPAEVRGRARAVRDAATSLRTMGTALRGREVDALSRSAIAVVDAACAGYAACRDAYQAVLDAEEVLRRALAHLPGAQVTR
ncbi:hypothetical protein [Promicromonospora sp. NPDC090134]|uniref:hypothetical protein n=1 Tax=Promicromonospora sp. NPDC090134 TaxID=3364408 RepID=UPI00381CB435